MHISTRAGTRVSTRVSTRVRCVDCVSWDTSDI